VIAHTYIEHTVIKKGGVSTGGDCWYYESHIRDSRIP